MAILILKLNTDTGHIDWGYPADEEGVPSILVNGGVTGYMNGDAKVISGWNLDIRIGDHPEERERRIQVERLIKWRERQKEVLNHPDFTGVDQEKLEGAIEMCNILLNEMGYREQEPAKEPSDSDG